MRIEPVDEVDAFAAQADEFLASDEANHTVLLSALQGAQRTLARGEPLPDGWSSVIVAEDGTVVAAARLWRGTSGLTTGPAEAMRALGARAVQRGPFTGIVGPEPAVQAFEAGAAIPARTHQALPLLRLDRRPAWPSAVNGVLRPAARTDRSVLLDWHEAFRVEARIEQTAAQVAADTERALRLGIRHLWADAADTPLGMIGGQRIAPTGARIGPVYTPPALRRHGIGGAMVAALALRLLDTGARCVFLFTDAANPTSNALYRRIGFAPIGLHVHRLLDAESST